MTLDTTRLRTALATVVVVPVTPFGPDGGIDAGAYAGLVNRMLDGGISVVTPNGNTGEFYALSPAEAREALQIAAAAAAGRARASVSQKGVSTMSLTTSYDPDTLALMADHATYGTGKKHYNPVPQSRIPRTKTLQSRSTGRLPRISPTPPDSRVWTQKPVYLLSVQTGQEFLIAHHIQQYTSAAGAMVPRNPDNEPFMPGFVLVAIPDPEFHAVTQCIRDRHWGFLTADSVDPELVRTFLPYADTITDTPISPWGPDHPLRQLGEAVLHREGWHGTIDADGWALADAHGRPITHGGFAAWWATLCRDWTDQQLPLGDIVIRHQDALIGSVVPVAIDRAIPPGDWLGTWMRQPVRVPAAAHQGIRQRPAKTIGVITGFRDGETQVSVTHPDLITRLLGYRMPIDASVRVPGRWAVIRVPQVTPTSLEHVRLVRRDLGWPEQWRVVDTDNPRLVVSALLKPRDIHVNPTTRQIVVQDIPGPRQDWVQTAREWLPEWTIVGL